MIFNIWRFIQLLLPYCVILWIYRHDKALPANIRTRTGRNLKAIMITTDYGILFSEEKYIKDRTKYLYDQKQQVDKLSDALLFELNSLSFEEKENLNDRKHTNNK